MDKSQTQLKQRDTMREQLGVDTNDKENYPLLERIEIKYSPFTLIGNEELGYKLTWGIFNLSDAQPKETYTPQWIAEQSWELTMKMVGIYVDKYWEMKEKARYADNSELATSMYDQHRPNFDEKEQ